tara:strand:- start:1633 stop:1932 length:300 start_codon:yes stop_codon:yes gene_type:complete
MSKNREGQIIRLTLEGKVKQEIHLKGIIIKEFDDYLLIELDNKICVICGEKIKEQKKKYGNETKTANTDDGDAHPKCSPSSPITIMTSNPETGTVSISA